jgi:heme exporter protein CcmD
MSTFFAMNGHGFYIWSAYGIATLTLAIEVLALRSRRKSVLAQTRLTGPDKVGVPGGAVK